MRYFTNYIFSALIILTSATYALAQDGLSEKVLSLEKFEQENYRELIFIQTDKRAYFTGERIHFKIFCLEKTTSMPSELSKIAYLEVLDKDNNQILQAKIELNEGTGYGEVFIPTNINSGNFVLRGYTRWMRNDGPETFYHSMITVINPFKKLGLKPLDDENEVSISFYPESGTPINGLKTIVVFDCKNANGHPVDVNGTLIANDSIIIKEFKPDMNGFGSFEFTPDIFNKYHVNLMHSDSTVTTHDFPPTVGKGLALQVESNSTDYMINLFCNDQTFIDPAESLYYIVQQKGRIVAKNNVKLLKGKASFSIDKSIINDGIATISLFDEEGKLLHRRDIFKYSNKINNSLNVNKSEFAARENATLDLSDLTDTNEPIDLSISVANYHKNFAGHIINLTDYLLLENSLQGFVYGLETFFQETETTKSINNLLIAFPNKSVVMEDSIPEVKKYIPEYRGALITGKIINKETKEPATGIYAFISIPGKNVQFDASKSRRYGQIIFEMKDFYGENEIIVQTDYTKDTIYSIEIDNPFSDEFIEIKLPEINIDEHLQKWIEHQSYNMQINNAYAKYSPKLPILNKVDSSAFYNEPDSRYYLDDYTRFIVMEEVMREYVYGVNLRKNQNGFHFMTLDLDRNDIFSENPLMLLDGVPVFDADEIIAFDPLKVEKIETVKRRFHMGYLDCHGIVSCTTYDGDLAGFSLNKKALVMEFEGIQSLKQYYSPKYASAAEKRSTTPDFRNTLYWNPSIKMDSESNHLVDFYTSDDANNYEIRINGISKDGQPYSISGFIKVLSAANN